MSKLTVYDKQGAAVGDVEVDDQLLTRDKGTQAVHDVVVNLMAHRRAGTASTRSKGEVAGTGAKPWKQKGTGRARAGYRQSPVWRGGAVAFGPRPHKRGGKVNKKVARLAFRRAFAEKVAAEEVKVIDSFDLPEPRTKCFTAMMKTLEISGRALFVADELDRNFALASRNVHDVEVALAKDVNVYQLLRHPAVVVSRAGMDTITKRLGGGSEEAA